MYQHCDNLEGVAADFYDSYHPLYVRLQLATWLGQIVAVTLGQHGEMGGDHASARDFLQTHVRLDSDIKAQASALAGVETAAEELRASEDPEGAAAADRVAQLKKQWDNLHQLVLQRIKLAHSYVAFHKKAQNVSSEAR